MVAMPLAAVEHDVGAEQQRREQERERAGMPRDQRDEERGRIAPREDHEQPNVANAR